MCCSIFSLLCFYFIFVAVFFGENRAKYVSNSGWSVSNTYAHEQKCFSFLFSLSYKLSRKLMYMYSVCISMGFLFSLHILLLLLLFTFLFISGRRKEIDTWCVMYSYLICMWILSCKLKHTDENENEIHSKSLYRESHKVKNQFSVLKLSKR